MEYLDLKKYIDSNEINGILSKIKGTDDLALEKQRYQKLLDETYDTYGPGDYHLISSPGRSEIGGNHTDHQHGNVLACGLNMDNIAVFRANNENIVRYRDGDFKIKDVDLSNLNIQQEEINTSEALIRGIASRLNELGYKVGGFDALCNSEVLVGSGISSSACFEMMVVEIFNHLYNNGVIGPVLRAKIGQYSENVYFGKASGLLDQMTISVGGFTAIDFKDMADPKIESYDFSFEDYGYQLFLVNTKGDHSDLSNEYSAIPAEMKKVAKQLDKEVLVESSLDALLDNFVSIRENVNNDRAILRSIHFYLEDERAIKEREAVKNKDIESLLFLMKESGRSSYEYLQNVYPVSRVYSQSLAIGLALCDICLKQDGAYRVHGGGFEGTIQAVVPNDKVNDFKSIMSKVFGDDCLMECKVRPFGTKTII